MPWWKSSRRGRRYRSRGGRAVEDLNDLKIAVLYADEHSFELDNLIWTEILYGRSRKPYGSWAKYLGASLADGTGNTYQGYALKPTAWRYPGYWWFRLRTSKMSFYRYGWWVRVRLRGLKRGTKAFFLARRIAAKLEASWNDDSSRGRC